MCVAPTPPHNLGPVTTAPPRGVGGRPVGAWCLGLGFGLWLRVGVGVGVGVTVRVGVGVGVAVRVGVVDGVGVTVPVAVALDVAVAVVLAVSLAPADVPVTDAVAFDRAADAAPPAHGSSTMPSDMDTAPAIAQIRPARVIRLGRELMVFLVWGIGGNGWSCARCLPAQLAGLPFAQLARPATAQNTGDRKQHNDDEHQREAGAEGARKEQRRLTVDRTLSMMKVGSVACQPWNGLSLRKLEYPATSSTGAVSPKPRAMASTTAVESPDRAVGRMTFHTVRQ